MNNAKQKSAKKRRRFCTDAILKIEESKKTICSSPSISLSMSDPHVLQEYSNTLSSLKHQLNKYVVSVSLIFERQSSLPRLILLTKDLFALIQVASSTLSSNLISMNKTCSTLQCIERQDISLFLEKNPEILFITATYRHNDPDDTYLLLFVHSPNDMAKQTPSHLGRFKLLLVSCYYPEC